MLLWIHNNIELLTIITGLILFSLFIYASVIFFLETEKSASVRSLYLALVFALIYFAAIYLNYQHKTIVHYILVFLPISLLVVLMLPISGLKRIKVFSPATKIDERDIMFSRRLLKKGDGRYEDYYRRNPQNLESDEIFRTMPGILNKGSIHYDKIMFASSESSFFTVEQLSEYVDGEIADTKTKFDQQKLTAYIKKWSKKLGALDVGVTEVKEYHKYSHVGRGEEYGEGVELNHKYAIAFTVEMDSESTACGPQAPIVMESGQQYLNAGTIAVQLAHFIRQLGYPARAHIDTNYRVVCPLVAKDAGLGEIGRMGLLMTPNQGPRVRIAVVTTDLPLIVDKKKEDKSMIHFCELCKKCADVCPSNSISFNERELIDGIERWQINSDTCFNLWCKVGTDCGRCMAACPYSHPDNALHNFIRFGIRNNVLFRKLAVILDDYFYGKFPKIKEVPKWMKDIVE